MRSLFLCITILFAVPLSAQTTNFHAGAVIGTTGGLGYASPDYGVTFGTDWRHGKFAFSIDTDILRVRKNVGGSGYSMSIKEHARIYVHKNLFVQASARQWRYGVTQFAKRGGEFGGGVGIEYRSNIFSINYSQEVWEQQSSPSPNSRMHTVESEAQFFLKHRIYVDARVSAVRFRSQHKPMFGMATRFGFGFWL